MPAALIDAFDFGLQAVLARFVLEETRSRAIAHLDELIERLDDLTARHADDIRAAGARLGIDAARIEQHIDAFVERHASERDWFVRQRNAALLGIVDLIDPLQV